MLSFLRFLPLLFALTFLSNTAKAGLIVDNDGYITDSITGYDWLDTSFTLGLSYNEVLSEISSGSLQGWSVASYAEVIDLLLHANNNSPFLLPSENGLTVEGIWSESISSFIDFTKIIGEGWSEEGVHGFMLGYVSDLGGSYLLESTWQRSVQIGYHANEDGKGFLRDASGGYAPFVSNPFISTWIVKRGVEVPEPPTLALLALSLLIFRVRRQVKLL